jgi:hypothetical protein
MARREINRRVISSRIQKLGAGDEVRYPPGRAMYGCSAAAPSTDASSSAANGTSASSTTPFGGLASGTSTSPFGGLT